MHSINLERRQLLESFGCGPTMLSVALRAFPRKMWVYKDSTNTESIHDIVWQLADNEIIEYIYCLRFVTDSGASPFVIDSSGLSGNLGHFYHNIKEALGIIRALRLATYHFLKMLRESAWDFPVDLPTHGRLTLHQWLQIRERNIPDHIQKLNQIYVAWIEAKFKIAWDSAPPYTGSTRVRAKAEAQFPTG
jgi:hypothetical protein